MFHATRMARQLLRQRAFLPALSVITAETIISVLLSLAPPRRRVYSSTSKASAHLRRHLASNSHLLESLGNIKEAVARRKFLLL